MKLFLRLAALAALPALAGLGGFPEKAEFYFLRMEYKDAPWVRRPWGRGWWMQDMPEADVHFSKGVERMTRVHVGDCRHTPLTDDGVFDYPWIYATQVGWWDLSDLETERLRKYLLRGGFLVVDDFFGDRDWAAFAATMARVLPGRGIEDIEDASPVMNMVFEIKERVFIPGLRHLQRGSGIPSAIRPQPTEPKWRAMYDDAGHMVVAINFNMDIGDAWEHADWPEYPEQMTGLSYRFGINYILYAMTH